MNYKKKLKYKQKIKIQYNKNKEWNNKKNKLMSKKIKQKDIKRIV